MKWTARLWKQQTNYPTKESKFEQTSYLLCLVAFSFGNNLKTGFRILIIITYITWLLKSMTERRATSVQSPLVFFLKLVAFVSGYPITLFVQHTETCT